MQQDMPASSIGRGLQRLLVAELLLSALVFFFVFIINGEDWFFGMKTEGISAGVSLFLKGLTAALLLALILVYPQHRYRIVLPAAAYYGFLILSSSVTIAKNTGGSLLFSPLFAVLLFIPVSLIVIRYQRTATA